MIYHRMNFMKDSIIFKSGHVDLFLSSVPLVILKNELFSLFGILKRIMRLGGLILIDAPVSMKDLIHRMPVESSGFNIHLHHILFNKNMYPGIDQWLYVLVNGDYPESLPILSPKFKIDPNRKMSHPCEFCPEFIRKLIESYSNEFSVVMDGFCGTGTVPKEAVKLNRVGIGCDLRDESNVR